MPITVPVTFPDELAEALLEDRWPTAAQLTATIEALKTGLRSSRTESQVSAPADAVESEPTPAPAPAATSAVPSDAPRITAPASDASTTPLPSAAAPAPTGPRPVVPTTPVWPPLVRPPTPPRAPPAPVRPRVHESAFRAYERDAKPYKRTIGVTSRLWPAPTVPFTLHIKQYKHPRNSRGEPVEELHHTFDLQVNPTTTPRQLAAAVQQETGIEPQRQRLKRDRNDNISLWHGWSSSNDDGGDGPINEHRGFRHRPFVDGDSLLLLEVKGGMGWGYV